MTAAVSVARPWTAPNPILTFLLRRDEDEATTNKVIRIRPGLGASGTPPHAGDEVDPVEIAALDSFPASDPPSWTGATVR